MARRQHNYLQLKTHIITSMLLIARSNINVSWLSVFFSSSVSIMCRDCFPSAYGVTLYLNTAVHLAWLLFFSKTQYCGIFRESRSIAPLFAVCSQGQRKHRRFTRLCSEIVYLCKKCSLDRCRCDIQGQQQIFWLKMPELLYTERPVGCKVTLIHNHMIN